MSLDERKEQQPLDLSFKYEVINSVLKAIKVLHSYNIIHGNINPSNILLDEKNDVFLTDYFLCNLYEYRNINHLFPMTSMYYQSPNRLLNKQLNGSDDLWSFAMLLFYLTDTLPKDSKNVVNMYKEAKRLANEKVNPTSDIFITLTAHDIIKGLSNNNSNELDEYFNEKQVDYLIRRFSSIFFIYLFMYIY